MALKLGDGKATLGGMVAAISVVAATGVAACMACHGPTGAGNPQAVFPALGGQHASYVEKALKDFRDGNRTNDTNGMMQGVVARMTDKEIAAVAQYIQGLER
ncbi:MAG: c-type cytochrome [Candidatus Thiodiazotropha sp.]